MSRILRAGTKIPVTPTLSGRVLTLEADVPVTDGWGSDDAFAGWLLNIDDYLHVNPHGGNLALHADDLEDYDIVEIVNGVRQHNTYKRTYTGNAIADLVLISSVVLPEGTLSEDEKKQRLAAKVVRDEADFVKELEAEKIARFTKEQAKADKERKDARDKEEAVLLKTGSSAIPAFGLKDPKLPLRREADTGPPAGIKDRREPGGSKSDKAALAKQEAVEAKLETAETKAREKAEKVEAKEAKTGAKPVLNPPMEHAPDKTAGKHTIDKTGNKPS